MSKFIHPVFPTFLLASLTIAGCGRVAQTSLPSFVSTPTPEAAPTPVISPLPTFTATSAPTFVPDTGWIPLNPGLERRIINLTGDAGRRLEYLYILRLEPDRYVFDVAYDPQAQTLEAWQRETGALVVVNGGYFRKEKETWLPVGLIIVNGEAVGSSYDSYAGMLAITAAGPELRWLARDPYDPAEPLRGGLQSFPLLVKPGGEMGFPGDLEDNQQARRTVIGQDEAGRMLFILAPMGYFTLHQLSAYLTASDLALDIALNLDGGPSSGLLLADPREEITASSSLPIVITVRER